MRVVRMILHYWTFSHRYEKLANGKKTTTTKIIICSLKYACVKQILSVAPNQERRWSSIQARERERMILLFFLFTPCLKHWRSDLLVAHSPWPMAWRQNLPMDDDMRWKFNNEKSHLRSWWWSRIVGEFAGFIS